MFFRFVNELINKNSEQESLLKARTKALMEAQDRVEALTEQRRIDLHNNEILIEQNTKLLKLLTEVADRTVQCPLDSERIVLNKIKELTHDYQSKS